ncbi:NADP-dependent 3-hydroxy acid dehydrogenase YdfG [Variovorax sp. OK605]|nr:NADP-dependent 3-hydroxy acid dehydrogenase YdfG [Variovorax sp. OK605]
MVREHGSPARSVGAQRNLCPLLKRIQMTLLQQPIGSPFGASSTALDVVAGMDLHGKFAIVTGGYSGIGVETVRALSQAGATVIVPARDRAKAQSSLFGIARVEIADMDLNDPVSISAFADRHVASGRPVSILINSAGIMAAPLHRDGDGHEGQLSTNHLGHFRLTLALWPALVKAAGARVISVSSRGHQRAAFDFDDPDFNHRPYEKFSAYGQSKTANALFAVGLNRRGRAHHVQAFSMHPGQVMTNLARYMTRQELAAGGALDENGAPVIDPESGFKTPQQGAATSVWAATSPLLDGLGGLYCEDCDVAILKQGEGRQRGVAAHAVDPEQAERLWMLSQEWTGAQLA